MGNGSLGCWTEKRRGFGSSTKEDKNMVEGQEHFLSTAEGPLKIVYPQKSQRALTTHPADQGQLVGDS